MENNNLKLFIILYLCIIGVNITFPQINIYIFALFGIIIIYLLNNIKLKEYFQSSPKIIITLTTSPKRIEFLEPLFENLVNQTVKPDSIILNLPHIFKRTQTTFKKIPSFITSNSLIKINRCEDIGPATKIIPTTKLFTDPETILISIDDDIKYRNNFIETLLKYEKLAPNAVITGESHKRIENSNKSLSYGELLEGYSSVLYKKKYFDNFNINTLLNYPKECYFADDFIISNYLKKEGIDIVITNEPKNNKTTVDIFLDYGNNKDALRNGADGNTNGNKENYKKCSKYLKSKNELYIKYYKDEDTGFSIVSLIKNLLNI
jgi:hypothetical protein